MATTRKNAKKKKLVIVESPSKAKTIGKYLGSTYKVVASVGHVRDLPKSKLGVDIEEDFEPQYINIRGKGDVIKELKKESKNASQIFLATDPDREGEAISWHLAYILGIPPEEVQRIEFNEITKDKIKDAISKPRGIDQGLVDAQQARRVLDRLVGYQISPLLWKKVQKGLSAGRVQSVALKILCDREAEIKNFVPQEYWTVSALFKKDKEFTAKLIKKNGKKLTIANKEENDQILKDLNNSEFTVAKVDKKKRSQKPYAPFTTSSLQQDASAKLGFNPRKTMMIAQQLYEGINVKGHGTMGLVTYIRTDSVRISSEARANAKTFIINTMGKEYYNSNFYSNKKKDIQDAHEAIRPTDIRLLPSDVESSLSSDQFKLYNLIWRRFIASQMAASVADSVGADIKSGDYLFRATGSRIIFDGFRKIYQTGDEKKDMLLPELQEEEKLIPKSIEGEQNYTQPPNRFTEAGLIKELEDKDIGRPSTYAPIVATLTDRKYVKRSKKTLIPTELGMTVTDLLKEYFKDILDVDFTANMEDQLDDVEMGSVQWKDVIRNFYKGFEKELEIANKEIEKIEQKVVLTDEVCEKCGRPMALKNGRFGEFLACTGYPECKNTKAIVKKIDVKCPKCGIGDIVARKSRRGKLFYGCSEYPECDQVFWYKPTNKKCPLCGSLLLQHKLKNSTLSCSNSECKYKE
ncbi:MAG: type I DNA topoisomerase [Clostridiales bacterium]|nr:type I DNA topoisomerase [Clostridiales bacterium]MDY6117329.1 type I DNA topoisomerase [Anaerovoracaceae bacterium]